MRAAPRPEPVREAEEVFLVNLVQDRDYRPLDDLVLQGGNRERALLSVRLQDVHAPARQCPVRSPFQPGVQIREIAPEVCLGGPPGQPVDAWGGVPLEVVEGVLKEVGAEMVEERGELLLLPCLGPLPYALQRL